MVCLLAATPARAGDKGGPPVEVAASLDSTIDRTELARSLRVELGSESGSVERIVVEPSAGGALVLVKLESEERRERVLLDDTPAASRARVLALAIGEIVRRKRVQASAPEASGKPTRSAPSPPVAAPLAPREPPDVAVALEGGALFAPRAARSLPFVRAVAFVMVSSRFAVRLGLDGMLDRADDVLGKAQLMAVVASVGADARLSIGPVTIEAGPQVSAGWAHGAGSAVGDAEGGSADAPVVFGGVGARVQVPARGRVFAALGLGAAYAIRGLELRADERRMLGLSGFLFDVAGGAGIRFGP